MSDDDQKRKDAVTALETAIGAVARLMFDDDEVVTDAVLVLGAQRIDDDGDRIGRVGNFPRHGSQPPYITAGLLTEAIDLLHNPNRRSDDD